MEKKKQTILALNQKLKEIKQADFFNILKNYAL